MVKTSCYLESGPKTPSKVYVSMSLSLSITTVVSEVMRQTSLQSGRFFSNAFRGRNLVITLIFVFFLSYLVVGTGVDDFAYESLLFPVSISRNLG